MVYQENMIVKKIYIYIPSLHLAVGTEEVFMGYTFLLAKDH